MKIDQYLDIMLKESASDLFLTTGAAPAIKVNGVFKISALPAFQIGEIREIIYEMMNEGQIKEFEKTAEMNFGLSKKNIGRFRVNVFRQRNEIGAVLRCIRTNVPDMDALGIPAVLKDVVLRKYGLVLFVGATGTGKSTSLASLIDYRNTKLPGHIITVEDPIEFLHKHKLSFVNQREIGVDTDNYENALANALRQAPDVILVGEIRTREVMEYALNFAETGHLCLSTLHAHNSNQAIERIINLFPHDKRQQVLLDLSLNLAAIVSQRLVNTQSGKRSAVFEVLLVTPLVADLIKREKIEDIKEVMQKSEAVGMQTFDTALFNLYRQGQISDEEAIRNADSPNNIRLKISLTQNPSTPPDISIQG